VAGAAGADTRKVDVLPMHIAPERLPVGFLRRAILGLFSRLYNADRYAGTGVGVASCQRIVERYQWSRLGRMGTGR